MQSTLNDIRFKKQNKQYNLCLVDFYYFKWYYFLQIKTAPVVFKLDISEVEENKNTIF